MAFRKILSTIVLSLFFAGEAIAHPGHNPQTSLHHEMGFALILVLFTLATLTLISIYKKRN